MFPTVHLYIRPRGSILNLCHCCCWYLPLPICCDPSTLSGQVRRTINNKNLLAQAWTTRATHASSHAGWTTSPQHPTTSHERRSRRMRPGRERFAGQLHGQPHLNLELHTARQTPSFLGPIAAPACQGLADHAAECMRSSVPGSTCCPHVKTAEMCDLIDEFEIPGARNRPKRDPPGDDLDLTATLQTWIGTGLAAFLQRDCRFILSRADGKCLPNPVRAPDT